MYERTITILTHAQLKTTVDQRSFECQLLSVNGARTYVIGGIEQEFTDIAPGCKISDGADVYHVRKILYWPSLKYTFIIAD